MDCYTRVARCGGDGEWKFNEISGFGGCDEFGTGIAMD